MDKGSGAVRRVPFWRSLQTKFALTYIVIVAAVLILPLFWKLDGIWASMVVAELLASVITVLFLVGKRKQYHYAGR